MSDARVTALAAAVQRHCDIADAQHAADLPLCIYLLQMREHYRWCHGLGFDAPLDRAALGHWLDTRERHWEVLQGAAIEPLQVDGVTLDAFDVDAINTRLQPHGLVYGAGHVGPGRPVFFLAERHPGHAALDGQLEGLTVQQCGRELARGLTAPPAALQGGRRIVLRRDALGRWLWERFETFSVKRGHGPFGAVALAYGLDDAAAFARALPRLVDDQAPMLLWHELGEWRAAQQLEPGWVALREGLQRSRAALQLRAVRDQIADLGTTLPSLLAAGGASSVHLWFANYDGLRVEMFPSLLTAYRAWCDGDQGAALRVACERGYQHFLTLALALVALREPDRVERRLADVGCLLD